MVDLNQTQREIIAALDSMLGECDTSELRGWIEFRRGESMTNSNVGQQARQLIEKGLIEKSGERDVDAPQPANVYRLTRKGHDVAEEIEVEERQQVTVGASEADLAELRETVGGIRERVNQVALRVDEAEETMETHESAVRKLDERTERLYEMMAGDETPTN